jgi:putative transposase
MPARQRQRRARTHDWQEIQQYSLWPEQQVYEKIRPVVLFGETAAECAKEIGASERTLHYQADQFERYGMKSLFVELFLFYHSLVDVPLRRYHEQ